CEARRDPALVVIGRTGAAGITSVADAVARAVAYEAAGVDALFFTGIKTRADLEAVAGATRLPILLGSPGEEIADFEYLAGKRVRIAVQGHAPIAAAVQAVRDSLQAIYQDVPSKQLKNIASSDFMDCVSRVRLVARYGVDFLGLK
ncbi:MAG: isocitrate lyase/phosphoenolpyruvate mutase family protein, partial [Xanthobacteraceae bacterium]